MLNKQTEKTIDWCTFSWNPIQALCLTQCPYCYMTRINKRFNIQVGTPELRTEYFKDLKSKKLKAGDRVFVGSSTDMFGDWISAEHIQKVIDACRERQDVTFLFLTKNPKRYLQFNIPKNCMKGMTVDTNKRFNDYAGEISFNLSIDFISFEPLLEDMENRALDLMQFSSCKWIIIGANSNKGAPKPPDKWADNIIDRARFCGIKVFVKDNYKYYTKIKEFPDERNKTT